MARKLTISQLKALRDTLASDGNDNYFLSVFYNADLVSRKEKKIFDIYRGNIIGELDELIAGRKTDQNDLNSDFERFITNSTAIRVRSDNSDLGQQSISKKLGLLLSSTDRFEKAFFQYNSTNPSKQAKNIVKRNGHTALFEEHDAIRLLAHHVLKNNSDYTIEESELLKKYKLDKNATMEDVYSKLNTSYKKIQGLDYVRSASQTKFLKGRGEKTRRIISMSSIAAATGLFLTFGVFYRNIPFGGDFQAWMQSIVRNFIPSAVFGASVGVPLGINIGKYRGFSKSIKKVHQKVKSIDNIAVRNNYLKLAKECINELSNENQRKINFSEVYAKRVSKHRILALDPIGTAIITASKNRAYRKYCKDCVALFNKKLDSFAKYGKEYSQLNLANLKIDNFKDFEALLQAHELGMELDKNNMLYDRKLIRKGKKIKNLESKTVSGLAYNVEQLENIKGIIGENSNIYTLLDAALNNKSIKISKKAKKAEIPVEKVDSNIVEPQVQREPEPRRTAIFSNPVPAFAQADNDEQKSNDALVQEALGEVGLEDVKLDYKFHNTDFELNISKGKVAISNKQNQELLLSLQKSLQKYSEGTLNLNVKGKSVKISFKKK